MKIPKDVLMSKGIAYIQKFPYGELSKVSKNANTLLIKFERPKSLKKFIIIKNL